MEPAGGGSSLFPAAGELQLTALSPHESGDGIGINMSFPL